METIELHRVYLGEEEYDEYTEFPGRFLYMKTRPDSELPEQIHVWQHVGHKFLNGDFSTFYHRYVMVAAYPIVETMQ